MQLRKLARRMAQIPVETQKANELAFGRFLSPHLVFAHERLFALHAPPAAADDAALTADVLAGQTKPRGLERVAIALMQFIGNVVSCSYYRPDLMSQIIGQSNGSSVRTISGKGDVNVTAEAVTETAAKISTHLTDKHVCDLCDFVVSTLLPLHGADLEQWNADPEGYLLTMEATTADESARAAAESLFLALLEVKSRAPRALARAPPVLRPCACVHALVRWASQARSTLLVPRLASVLCDHASQAAVVAPNAPLRSVLQWDAIYLVRTARARARNPPSRRGGSRRSRRHVPPSEPLWCAGGRAR